MRIPRPGVLAAALAVTATGVTGALIVRAKERGNAVSATNPFAPAQAEADGDVPVIQSRSVGLSFQPLSRRRVRLTAVASPARPGQPVFFQRQDGSRWVTIGSASQGSGGEAEYLWNSPPGILSVRSALPTSDDGDPVYSAPATVSVLSPGARVIRWREWVEDGIEGRDEFVAVLKKTFADQRGWASTGDVSFIYSPTGAVNMLARLATPKTTDRLCYPADTRGKWSCHAGGSIVINSARWFKGSPSLAIPLADYRALVINHETGHALGFGHTGCGGRKDPAPVMMQQSKGLDGCVANPWPARSELRRL